MVAEVCPITECLNTPPSDKGPLCHDHTLALDVLRWALHNDEPSELALRYLVSTMMEAKDEKEAKAERKPKESKKTASEE